MSPEQCSSLIIERLRQGIRSGEPGARALVTLALLVTLATSACRRGEASVTSESSGTPGTAASEVTRVTSPLRPAAAPPDRARADAGAPPVLHVSELQPAGPADACPATMSYVAGGEFWMGSVRGRGEYDERPRFLTRVANFCLDTYEVTTASYMQCVAHGQCSEARGVHGTCNYGQREDHPINCVDWAQADAYCRSQGARLPTELEWEYAARGGRKYFQFSWGSEPPDGHACWKSRETCPVGSYGPGAFGLRDVTGNVWEWTADWFGLYPWPAAAGRMKVFRGGGYNRRSDRWLSSTLRNRAQPSAWSAQLGFRCARLASDAACPFGPGDEPGVCRHGVLDVECAGRMQSFNGQRCAAPGAPACRAGEEIVPGHGCVRRAQDEPSDGDDAAASDVLPAERGPGE